MKAEKLTISFDGERTVSGLVLAPRQARVCFVMAHGAGGGMGHPFMTAVAEELLEREIATLRYQFWYTERGSGPPDPPERAHAVVRAAVAAARQLMPELPLLAGGKSFGGRMTSQAQAVLPLPGVVGLIFLGFPLHPPRRPSVERARHLENIRIPMLFIQGSRDLLAEPALLGPVVEGLGRRATVALIDNADHSFHKPAGTQRDDAPIGELADVIETWLEGRMPGDRPFDQRGMIRYPASPSC
jgi:predicted alpha/beta-hydrolase family hydrolase